MIRFGHFMTGQDVELVAVCDKLPEVLERQRKMCGDSVAYYGDPNHWRNNSFVTYYCTHSLGPIIHATGLRPVKVTGFESKQNKRRLRVGCKSGEYAIEMVELENGGMIRSVHGGL